VSKIWNDHDLAREVSHAIVRALEGESGDLLVFLPGQGEIRRVQRLLEEQTLPKEIRIRPLYGELRSLSKMPQSSRHARHTQDRAGDEYCRNFAHHRRRTRRDRLWLARRRGSIPSAA